LLKSHREYFSEFSDWYEDERHGDYHEMVDDLESDLVRRFALDRDVLDVGCGSGLILGRVQRLARRAIGVESDDSLRRDAEARGLEVVPGSLEALPFDDASFDVVYSFKRLAHQPDVEEAVDEMVRVTRPGGHLLLEFYNPMSLRYLGRRLSGRRDASVDIGEDTIYTRWDPPNDIRRRFPDEVELIDYSGIRVVTPGAFIHDIPWIRQFVRKMEFTARDSPLRYFGGFLVAILRKRDD
jgi:SAM-dependent methyltransferase